MDDVALIATKPEEMQEMLNLTENVAKRYHILFGREKSQVVKIGKGETKVFQLDEAPLDNTDKCKYLGLTVNSQNNLNDHIPQVKGKVEASYQNVLAIVDDNNFKGLRMKPIWKLIESASPQL